MKAGKINNMKIISKSNYTLFKNCPKSLWLSFYKSDVAAPLTMDVLKRIEDGKEVGDLAKKYFANTIDVKSLLPDGSLDISKMLELTKKYLKQKGVTIAEASFKVNNLFCSIDLLRVTSEGYEIYEVKSTTEAKVEHKVDAAFQKYVLQQYGLNVINTYILHLNKDYIRKGDLELDQLFTMNHLDEDTSFIEAMHNMKSDLKAIDKLLLTKAEPAETLLTRCKNCDFKDYCQKDIPVPSVLDVYRLSGYKYLNKGIVTFEDLLESNVALRKRQSIQVHAYLDNKEVIIDKKGLASFLKKIKYPVYHLDFESYQVPIPPCNLMKPYDQIPTQYSLHIEYEDGSLEHKAFLGNSLDPRREIAESLCANIPRNACVTAYYKGFECGRLNELATLFPDLEEHLLNISKNVIDLLEPFESGYYYHKNMGKSNSIKAVLPALYPDDSELDYSALPVVHNGSEAMVMYPIMLGAKKEEKERIRNGLLEYCRLDTLAMVKLLQKLRKTQ